MTPRATFLAGAALGASFAAGVLVDAACDVTARVACWVAPWQRQIERGRFDRRVARGDLMSGDLGRLSIETMERKAHARLGPCTGTLPDPADGT